MTETQNRKLERLRELFRRGRIVLFLGAGVNQPRLVPGWGELLTRLLESARNMGGLDPFDVDDILELDAPSRAGVIKDVLGLHYLPLIQRILYEAGGDRLEREAQAFRDGLEARRRRDQTIPREAVGVECPLLVAVAALCLANRNIQAVVTYNYDGHLKSAIAEIRRHVVGSRKSSVSAMGRLADADLKVLDLDPLRRSAPALRTAAGDRVLPVYHVHGYVYPPGSFRRGKNDVVLAQEEYFRVMNEPFSWQTVTQLHFLMNDTCVFLGCSLTDMNILRLVSYARREADESRVYNVTSLRGLGADAPGKGGSKSKDSPMRRLQENAGVVVVVTGTTHEDTLLYVLSLLEDSIRADT